MAERGEERVTFYEQFTNDRNCDLYQSTVLIAPFLDSPEKGGEKSETSKKTFELIDGGGGKGKGERNAHGSRVKTRLFP